MCLHQLAKIAVEKMGGTSGAVYGLFLRGIASSLRGASASDWASAWKSGIDCILKYSSARLGDRTLVSPLFKLNFSKQVKTNSFRSMWTVYRKTYTLLLHQTGRNVLHFGTFCTLALRTFKQFSAKGYPVRL